MKLNPNKSRFIWDENKHEANKRKHGIDFFEAATVFDDPNAEPEYDHSHSHDEERFKIVGISDNMRLLLVCHCYRDGDSIRIISARKATRLEANKYGGAR